MCRYYSYNTVIQKGLSLLFILLIGWLTISLPIVSRAQNKMLSLAEQAQTEDSNSSDNYFPNSPDEKCPNNANTVISEEYLHHSIIDFSLYPLQDVIAYLHSHEGTYIAFHGELLCPPPNKG